MPVLSISENILYVICGFGTLQGILLALAIYFHPKSDRSVNLFLASYIITLSIIAAVPFVRSIVTWQKSFFIEPFTFLAGPSLYLYIRSFKETITWRKAIPHLIIFFLFFFVSYWFLEYMSGRFPYAKEIPGEALYDPLGIAFASARIVQVSFYYFLSRRTLIHYQRSIRQLFSDTSRIDLRWIKWLINGLLIMVLCSIVIYSFILRYPEYFNLLLLINMAILTPYIYLAAFKGITQPTIWQINHNTDKQELEEEMQEAEHIETEGSAEKSRYQKPGLDETRVEVLVSKIIALMEQEKLYQETELSLQNLAEKLQAPAHHVSYAINEGMKKTFYDVINSYRVEEAKRLLLDPRTRNYTVLSVGFEAGFNSKTTFNTVFKKFTGLTPTDFREKEKFNMAEA